MSKYIDAEKLISKILKLRSESCISESDDYYEYAKSEIIDIIESLQQERTESSNGKLVFPNFIYARTVNNKTIDVSYAPKSLDAVEYIKNDPIEPSEVDLEKEYEDYVVKDPCFSKLVNRNAGLVIARHFYEFGLNARTFGPN